MKNKIKTIPSKHSVNVFGERYEISIFDNFYSFKAHAQKHMFTQLLWKKSLGSNFTKYINAYKNNTLTDTMYTNLYFELVFPRICMEIDCSLDEPLFVEFLRRKNVCKEKLPESDSHKCIKCIGTSSMTLALENNVLKTAYFATDDLKVSQARLRMLTYSSLKRTILNNRIYQTYSKGKPLFVKIEDVRWVLSDFWKKLSKRVKGKRRR